MAKTQTKTEIRNTTAKVEKLLRGIDNQTEQARKDQKKLDARWDAIAKDAAQVRTLISSVSNAALNNVATTAAPAAKPAAKTQAKPATKPASKEQAKKTAAKPAAKAQAKPATKAAAKPQKGQGSAKKPTGKAPASKTQAKSGERRPLKTVINEVLGSNAMKAADIYKEVTRREGYYSRQSLYMALKSDEYVKDGDTFRLAPNSNRSSSKTPTTDDVDAFVKEVDRDQSVAAVV